MVRPLCALVHDNMETIFVLIWIISHSYEASALPYCSSAEWNGSQKRIIVVDRKKFNIIDEPMTN